MRSALLLQLWYVVHEFNQHSQNRGGLETAEVSERLPRSAEAIGGVAFLRLQQGVHRFRRALGCAGVELQELAQQLGDGIFSFANLL